MACGLDRLRPNGKTKELARAAPAEAEGVVQEPLRIGDGTRPGPTLGKKTLPLLGGALVDEKGPREALLLRPKAQVLDVAPAEGSAEMPHEHHDRGALAEGFAQGVSVPEPGAAHRGVEELVLEFKGIHSEKHDLEPRLERRSPGDHARTHLQAIYRREYSSS